jgi:hypothetical protein
MSEAKKQSRKGIEKEITNEYSGLPHSAGATFAMTLLSSLVVEFVETGEGLG